MIRRIVKLPAYICVAAGWTVIIGGVYANYLIREGKHYYRKHNNKRK
jgi:hypothetical protein